MTVRQFIMQTSSNCYEETVQLITKQAHTFNGPLSGTTRVSRYQKGKTNLHFTEARDSEWHWHQLGHMQVCISLQTVNHASTQPLSILQARCPSCHPTNSVKAPKAQNKHQTEINKAVETQLRAVQRQTIQEENADLTKIVESETVTQHTVEHGELSAEVDVTFIV